MEVEPDRSFLANLNVANLGLLFNCFVAEVLLVELLVIEVQEHVEWPEVLQLFVVVRDAFRTHLVLSVAQVLVNVVAGDEDDFEALVLGVPLLAIQLDLLVPVDANQASFLIIFEPIQAALGLACDWVEL